MLERLGFPHPVENYKLIGGGESLAKHGAPDRRINNMETVLVASHA